MIYPPLLAPNSNFHDPPASSRKFCTTLFINPNTIFPSILLHKVASIDTKIRIAIRLGY